MEGFNLFETTDSVIEVIWDIALAYFIVRLGFIYFAVNFVSSLYVSYLTSTNATHFTATAQSEVWLIVFLALVSAIWTRFIVRWYEVPRVTGLRLAIGAVALVLTATAEALVGFVLYEEGRGDWILRAVSNQALSSAPIGAGYGTVLGIVGLMPWVQMLLVEDDLTDDQFEKTQHDHEKKSLVDAVPTVDMAEKSKKGL